MRRFSSSFALVAAGLFAFAPPASAQDVIVSPVGGVIDAGGPGYGPLGYTFDQSGLSAGFISGTTLFDAFLAGAPTHTSTFAGYEWFSRNGSSAMVTYDLGSVMSVNRLALWNEESSGIGTLDLWGSTNGTDFFSLALGLVPTDHQSNAGQYGADVFAWAVTDLRYVRFGMQGCPQPSSDFDSCAIGEVAFAAALAGESSEPVDLPEGDELPEPLDLPEPGSAVLLLSGIAGLAFARRRTDR